MNRGYQKRILNKWARDTGRHPVAARRALEKRQPEPRKTQPTAKRGS